jgi:protein disulfide-isomerase-like protein
LKQLEKKMAILRTIAVASLLTLSAANVPILNGETFDAATKDQNAMIKFYAPWCGHCKRMTPAWNELHEHHGDSKLVVAKVDCTKEDSKDLCRKMGVRGFPAVKYQVSHKVGEGWQDYHAARDIVQLKNFAAKTFVYDVWD